MPTSDVKQDPTQTRLTWNPDGFTGQLGWTVSWPTTEEAVRQQMLAYGVYVNSPHPNNGIMLCRQVDVDMSPRNLAKVTASYQQTDSPFPDKSDPLKEPPRFMPSSGWNNEPVDRDPNGDPIVNSAGDVFQGLYDDIRTRFFTITVNLPFWNFGLDLAYAGRCNSQPWSPLGIGSLDRGQAKCLQVMPTGEITKASLYVPVAYQFEIRSGQRALALGGFSGVWDGFQRVLIDQGEQGWYSSTQKGPFVNENGESIGSLLLDSTGRPILSTAKVQASQGSTPAPVATPSSAQTKGAKFQVLNPTAWFLTFQKTLFADFNDFGF